MRAICLALALTMMAGLAMAEEADGFFPYDYENHTLDNGFKAILMPIQGSGLVAYYTVVRTGARDEWEPGKSGFAHFFEHMMFRGTEKYPAAEYSRIVAEMGANSNAYTSDDITAYYMVIPNSALEIAIDLESDRFQNLSYEEGPFKTEAGAVYGEYNKNATSPTRVGWEKLMDTAFDKHTYKHTTMGFVEDIKDMPNQYEYSKSFFDRYYRPENCVVLIVGDFDPEAAKPMINQYYGGWESGYVPPEITPEPPQTEERRVEVPYNGRTLPLLWVAYKSDAYDPTDKLIVAAYLMGDLAFGNNSELYKKLVIDEQKVNRIAPDFRGNNRDPKVYDMYLRVKDSEDVPYVLEQVTKTADAFKNDLVSQEELDKVRERRRYEYLLRLDTPGNVASRLARTIAITGGIEAVDQLYSTMDMITPEDIREAAQKYLQNERRTVLVLTGEEESS